MDEPSFEASKPDPDSGAWDHEDFAEWNAPVRTRLLPSLVIAAMVAWTVLFIAAEWDILSGGASVAQIASLIGAWTMPILLLCAIWLLLLQNGRHEVARFGDAARLLAHEATQLEARITTINQELSLAREFIGAQSRDLETLGRLAADRLSDNAQRLQDLIQANGSQLDAIAGVSSTALDNMERLRGQLPVVASSAKDVANTIGHAGRTAEEAMAGLASELDRVTAAGHSGHDAITALHARVEASLSLFDGRLEEIQTAIVGRVELLEHHAAELRQQL
ncbi:MAG TPA: ATPase, partial [Novosphingobium sp.]